MKKTFSAAVLKTLAVALMLVNHFVNGYCEFIHADIVPKAVTELSWYLTRGAFVLFAFLIAEGMIHTSSRLRYIGRLAALAVISEFPFDYAFYGEPVRKYQNVFLTLSLAALCIYLIDKLKGLLLLQVLVFIAICGAAYHAHGDYQVIGIMLVAAFYYLRGSLPLMFAAAAGALFFGYALNSVKYLAQGNALVWHYAFQELCGAIVFPFIARYNGKRGKQPPKWICYGIYPAHLLVLCLIRFLSI